MHNHLPERLSSFIWYFLRPYKFVVATFITLASLAGFWGPFNNILIKEIINILPQVQAGDISLLTWPAILIVLNFIIFDNITWRTIGYINYKFEAVIKNQIISQILDLILDKSYQYFQDNLSGAISHQITVLAENIELILHRISQDFIRGVSLLIISFATAYYVNPLFFYILFLWFIAFSFISISMSSRLVILSDNHAKSESIVSGQIVDCITNHTNVRLFAKKNYEVSRMGKFLEINQKAFQTKESFVISLYTIQGLLIAIMMGFSTYFLVYLYGKKQITDGDFALILGLSMQLGHMMWYTMGQVDELNKAIGKCKQSLFALIVKEINDDGIPSSDLFIKNGQISFEAVNFQYHDAALLFQNKSVLIPGGQKVGLVGYSGSGKSTFVNLILRLYNVTKGRILIDSQNIKNVRLDSLRQHIAMIPQDPFLFHRSLIDNIRYGDLKASDEEVMEAAKQANAHEFIIKLPQGYQTLVGERGVKLSGGQRQRIAIARAILKKAPILILDEATSQLDSITECKIQESLQKIMQGKTTIVIAHRLSTLLKMDRIFVFDKGKIVEEGSHFDLLKINGLYKTLWDTQVGGLLPNKKLEGELQETLFQ